jgi:hypothetical protein
MDCRMTLLDLVDVVSEHCATEGEVVAVVAHLVNSGAVRLCGNFRDAAVDLAADDPSRRASDRLSVLAAAM